jgi:hypothetical protein
MAESRTRRRFTAEFKAQAVNRVLDGRSLSKVATELGLSTGQLSTWRGRRYKALRRLKVSEKVASAAIFSPKGPWRLSSASALHRAFTNKRFKGLGLVAMETLAGT